MASSHRNSSSSSRTDIRCAFCGRDSWLVRKPRYEGFTRTGEDLSCALCGHALNAPSDYTLLRTPTAPPVFTDADRPRPVDVFAPGENERMCRHCAEYVINPFLQRCGLHQREVEATDTCPHFTPKPPPPPSPL